MSNSSWFALEEECLLGTSENESLLCPYVKLHGINVSVPILSSFKLQAKRRRRSGVACQMRARSLQTCNYESMQIESLIAFCIVIDLPSESVSPLIHSRLFLCNASYLGTLRDFWKLLQSLLHDWDSVTLFWDQTDNQLSRFNHRYSSHILIHS